MRKEFQYGRLLEDFQVGATYEHPWEVTVDAGTVGIFQACFQDAVPTFASARYARELGLRDRPMHSLLLLNFALSFSVHDVSEQAIAHLAYQDVRFPAPCFAGDTLTATSTVLGAKAASAGDRGVVHVRTILANQDERVVCTFERKALVRAGKLSARPEPPYPPAVPKKDDEHTLPPELREGVRAASRKAGFAGFAEDFAPGDVITHAIGKTVSDAEHMQLAFLFRNSHPLHFDEVYCKAGASFAGTRVVYGGLVFGWVASLASRDTCGNVVWDVRYDNGAHPSGVVAGDTIYAASKVLTVASHDARTSLVTFRLVGVKNTRPADLLESGVDLFTSELAKKDGKVKEKVFEIDRTVLMRKRG
ncbi:MAG: MaoC family dehydratase [Polyangiaceae bacterium]|jgi:2-methylfumaryl-CoA hydratase